MLTHLCFQARVHSVFWVHSKLQKTWPESRSTTIQQHLNSLFNYLKALLRASLASRYWYLLALCFWMFFEKRHLWPSPFLVNEINISAMQLSHRLILFSALKLPMSYAYLFQEDTTLNILNGLGDRGRSSQIKTSRIAFQEMKEKRWM